MLILFYAIATILAIFLIYKLSFKYKIINQAIALTAMVMLFIVVPPQVKIMMLVVSFDEILLRLGISNFNRYKLLY
ncbi:MAG: hypothetical protein RL154_161 [Pseudomonadota bacterium]|jgi:hypothetical protein